MGRSKPMGRTLQGFIETRPGCRDIAHLIPFIQILEKAPRGNLRVMCSLPIRHGKTWTIVYAIVYWLKKDPTLRVIVMTHTSEKAKELAKDIRQLAREHDVTIQVRKRGLDAQEGYDTVYTWRTEQGGGVSVKTPGTSRLGADCDILIVDDPFESQVEADKPEIRDQIDNDIAFYTNRLSINGSVIIVMSRFHPDDVIGRRLKLKRGGWADNYFHASAIVDLGKPTERAFAPSWWPLEEIKERRADEAERDPSERTFFAQWQNEPFAPETNHFQPPARYPAMPTWPGIVTGGGIDMAFSRSRSADWFAVVVASFTQGLCYVRNVFRFKGDPREASNAMHAQQGLYGVMPWFSYVSGPERVAIPMLAEQGLSVQPMQAEVNKLWRAQRMIRLWNAGKILLPASAPWVEGFISRAKTFRGVDGDDDDEIDALVSLVNAMMWPGGSGTSVLGRRRM